MIPHYDIFISHAWHRDEEYYRIVAWLNQTRLFSWSDLSVPEDAAIVPDRGRSLEYHLHNFMRCAGVFILCAGLYASHSQWIEYEIGFARRIGVPIIAVAPWGAQRLPAGAAYARTTVSRSDSLVRAILELGRSQ